MYVWLCERPGDPGWTIGSSLLRWLKLQRMAKYEPPGKDVSRGALMPVVARTADAATARTSGTSFNNPLLRRRA
jgi:hypothetical protein